MVTAEHKCYLFKEGYIRMSGQVYDLSQTDNLFVHLTNNAIQKHDTNYNKFEEGNILSFKEGTVSSHLMVCVGSNFRALTFSRTTLKGQRTKKWTFMVFLETTSCR